MRVVANPADAWLRAVRLAGRKRVHQRPSTQLGSRYRTVNRSRLRGGTLRIGSRPENRRDSPLSRAHRPDVGCRGRPPCSVKVCRARWAYLGRKELFSVDELMVGGGGHSPVTVAMWHNAVLAEAVCRKKCSHSPAVLATTRLPGTLPEAPVLRTLRLPAAARTSGRRHSPGAATVSVAAGGAYASSRCGHRAGGYRAPCGPHMISSPSVCLYEVPSSPASLRKNRPPLAAILARSRGNVWPVRACLLHRFSSCPALDNHRTPTHCGACGRAPTLFW